MARRTTRAEDRGVHVYGPVPSRRLGYSLGVDILPFKTCSMDCVYCQLGPGARTTTRRREYIPARTVLKQIREALAAARTVDAVTFSGSGEPLLNSGIGRIIAGIRRMTDVRIVVLTNSSGLVSPGARRDVSGADIVVPSLDAATERIFAKINRPHKGLTVEKIISGLVRFRREFKGQIWLEIMLVKGINDSPAHLLALKKAIARIAPDRVQLNTVVRPPAEKSARPLRLEELEKIRDFFGGSAEIIAAFSKESRKGAPPDPGTTVLETLRRRPMTASDLCAALGLPPEEILAGLRRLEFQGLVRSVAHGGAAYYEPSK